MLPGAPGIVPSDLRIDDIAIRRVPLFWADDLAMRDPQNTWREASSMDYPPGLKVFAFHPFHVLMNASDYRPYEALKHKRSLLDWTPNFVAPFRGRDPGAGTVLKTLTALLSDKPTLFLKDLLGAEVFAA